MTSNNTGHQASLTTAPRTVPEETSIAGSDPELSARYTHFELLPVLARAEITPELLHKLNGAFIGWEPERLAQLRSRHQEQIDASAADLLQDPRIRAAVGRIPFAPGDRIAIVGDSITADSLGWAYLLAAVLAQSGRTDLTVLNLAVSGHTTHDAIAMFDLVAQSRPDWILQMLGTNDARRHGAQAQVRMLSSLETSRNLESLKDLVRLETNARLITLTPAPMNQAMFDSNPAAIPDIMWRDADIDEIAEITRRLTIGAAIIDIHRHLQGFNEHELYLPDGVHPTLTGQKAIAIAVIQGLADLGPD